MVRPGVDGAAIATLALVRGGGAGEEGEGVELEDRLVGLRG